MHTITTRSKTNGLPIGFSGSNVLSDDKENPSPKNGRKKSTEGVPFSSDVSANREIKLRRASRSPLSARHLNEEEEVKEP